MPDTANLPPCPITYTVYKKTVANPLSVIPAPNFKVRPGGAKIPFFADMHQLHHAIGASRHQRSWKAKEDVVRMCEK